MRRSAGTEPPCPGTADRRPWSCHKELHAMRRILLLLGALTLAARAVGAEGSPLAGDSRFQKRLTLSIKGTAVAEVLDDLRITQGLPVRADEGTGDDRINLFCRDRPASEILRAVADALDFTWQHDTRGTG